MISSNVRFLVSERCCPSKRRIDLRKLFGNTSLCIEFDEDQHKRYDKVDEMSRYNELFMDFSGKYIFIRLIQMLIGTEMVTLRKHNWLQDYQGY